MGKVNPIVLKQKPGKGREEGGRKDNGFAGRERGEGYGVLLSA